jgi:large subunit ribosomal protein L18
MKSKYERHQFRTLRVRNNIRATSQYPRLTVFRSLKHIYAQVIDDVQGKTLAAASSKTKEANGASGIKAATFVGEQVAKKAVKSGVTQVVFDRGGRPYHGRVKALADAAREAGLKF